MTESCADCSRFLKCTRPERGTLICSKFAPWSDTQKEVLTALFGKNVDIESEVIAADIADEDNFQRKLAAALSPANSIPPDLKIDDRDLKEYPNFFEFCMDPQGLDQAPLARQLVIFTHLFGEYCVSGDTYVQTNQGLIKVKDVSGSKPYGPVTGFNITNLQGIKQVAEAGVTKRRASVLRIQDANGHVLTCTPDHRIQVLNDSLELVWVRARDLKLGDYTVTKLGHNLWSEKNVTFKKFKQEAYWSNNRQLAIRHFNPPTEMTPDLARFIGYIIADGYYTSNTLHFTNTDKGLVSDFINVSKSLFNVEPTVRTTKPVSKSGVVCKKTYEIRLAYKTICDYLTFIGFEPGICYTKVMPQCVLRSSKECVLACIRAIIDCDGYIQGDGRRRVGIKCSSPELVQQIRYTLNNLGIYATVQFYDVMTTKYGKQELGVHTSAGLEIYGDYASDYIRLIGSNHSVKRRVKAIVHTPGKFNKGQYGRIKPGVIPYAREALAKMYTHVTEYNESTGAKGFDRTSVWNLEKVCSSELYRWNKRKETGYARKLKALQALNLAYAPITSIEALEEKEDVYDLRVPEGENFVANGIIIHNCPFCSHEIFTLEDFPVDYPVAEAKEHVQFLEYGVCPKCKRHKSEMVRQGDLNNYIELALCCGQRSGKSIGVSLASGYITHKTLKLQDPTKVYELTKNTTLGATFVALTFSKAKDLLFTPLVDSMDQSPWFQQYHELLDVYAEKYNDEDLYTFGKEMVIYKHRKFRMYPASPNKRVLRGDTRFLSVIDELGWFPFGEDSDERERAGANEVYTALDRSMLTVRAAARKRMSAGYDNVPTAYGLYASSPSAYNDKIMSLVRAFSGSDIGLAAHFATWEMNPNVPRTDPSIQKAYLENPVAADRDYGAQPPLADAAFIADPTEFQSNFTAKPNLLGRYTYTVVTRQSGMERRSAKFKEELRPVKGPCVLGIDAGSSNNSFGITLARLDANFKRPQLLGMMEIAPDHRKPLDHAYIYKHVILPVVKAYQVVRVYVDRWQSLKIIHDIEMDTADYGYEVRGVEYSMRMADFEFVLDFMRDPEYTPQFPKLEADWQSVFTRSTEGYPHCFKGQPIAHFLFQMATVRATRKNVDKGQGYTDDVFRSAMLCLTNLYDDEVVEELKNCRFERATGTPKALITSVGYSTSGGSPASTGGGVSGKSIVVGQRSVIN